MYIFSHCVYVYKETDMISSGGWSLDFFKFVLKVMQNFIYLD